LKIYRICKECGPPARACSKEDSCPGFGGNLSAKSPGGIKVAIYRGKKYLKSQILPGLYGLMYGQYLYLF